MKRLIKRYVLKAQVDKENDEVNEGKPPTEAGMPPQQAANPSGGQSRLLQGGQDNLTYSSNTIFQVNSIQNVVGRQFPPFRMPSLIPGPWRWPSSEEFVSPLPGVLCGICSISKETGRFPVTQQRSSGDPSDGPPHSPGGLCLIWKQISSPLPCLKFLS